MNRIRNQGGQLILEAILLIVAMFAITLFISQKFKSNDIISGLVSGPWKSLAGMIQNGNWGSPRNTMLQHPSHHNNHVSLRGEEAE